MKKKLLIKAIGLIGLSLNAFAQSAPAVSAIPVPPMPTAAVAALMPPNKAALAAKPDVSSISAAAVTDAKPAEKDVTTVKKSYFNDVKLIIGTGSLTGIYYPAGGAICRMLNKERQNLGIKCTIETTSGSVSNLEGLKNDEFQVAIIQSDWEESAYNGTGPFVDKRMDNLRFLFSLHNESLTVIVPQQSNIVKFADIKGHKVNIGEAGSGVRSTMDEVLKAKGWATTDFRGLTDFKVSDQIKGICNGTIDVMVISTGHPNGTMQEIIKSCDVRLVEIDDPDIQKLIDSNPEYSATVIPGGIYPGIPKDVKTFGVQASVVALDSFDTEIAYYLVKLVFENLSAFKTLHPVFGQLDELKMVTEGKAAPYHPGALKYFQEKGYKLKQ